MKTARQRKASVSERPSVYAFHDYRAFLKALIDYRKAVDGTLSLRSLARQAGLTVSFLSMVTNQKRSLLPESFRRVSEALELSKEEISYLNLLRIIGDTDSSFERTQALQKITRLTNYAKTHPSATESYKYLTHWYYVAIREMSALAEFSTDPEWIQRKLRTSLPLSDIKEAIGFLISHGYLQQDSQGAYRQSGKDLDCTGGLYRLAIVNFHREMLGIVSQTLEEVGVEERFVTSHTMSIRASDYEKVVAVLEKTIRELAEVGRLSNEPEVVYHIALTAVPLTRNGGSK